MQEYPIQCNGYAILATREGHSAVYRVYQIQRDGFEHPFEMEVKGKIKTEVDLEALEVALEAAGTMTSEIAAWNTKRKGAR